LEAKNRKLEAENRKLEAKTGSWRPKRPEVEGHKTRRTDFARNPSNLKHSISEKESNSTNKY
jgi:hypothetical protein